MSYEDLLQRQASPRTREPANGNTSPADQEGIEDLGSFGWLRGIRERSDMVELRKRDGSILAVDYMGLEIEFDPSEGITLTSTRRKIRIQGRNLNAEIRPMARLFQGLVRHRVPWVQEAIEPDSMEASEDATVIEEITW